MAAILLVHGAWHDERCWEHLAPKLRSHGHEVHSLTLPGHWHRSSHPLTVSLSAYGSAICEAAVQIQKPVTLVGHSMGGLAISAASERDPFLFDRLIYLAAFSPRPNGWVRAQQLAGTDAGSILNDSVNVSYPRFKIDVKPEQARALFYHDVDPVIAKTASERLHSQSIRPIVEPLRVSVKRWGAVPRMYIECTEDQTISIELQRRMQAATGFQKIMTMNASHSPFLSMPEELAVQISEICAHKSGRPEAPALPCSNEGKDEQVALALQQTA